MKIAQIAPLAESVPPKLHGATERVVSYLTEELVRLGHDVTRFATGDSLTGAHEFDVLHFHLDRFHLPAVLPFARPFARRTLTTLHGRMDPADLAPLYREFGDLPLVSISQSQRAPLPGVNWAATVYHGLAGDVCPFNPFPRGGYAAFLGRAAPEKGLERALEIARRAGMRLRIAAKIDDFDERYFRDRIAPHLRPPEVEFVGALDERRKPRFLGNATALLFPVDWPEPFGLAMIEAMSCGTPVLAFPRGAVPEIVEDGITGRVVESIDQAVEALRGIARLDRRSVRRRFEERFSAERMTRDYLSVYRSLPRLSALSAA